jgi:hypothetical protein
MSLSKHEIKEKAAFILLRSGRATISEAAKLRGVSRQAMHQATDFDVRRQRELYLRTLWKGLVSRLTG